MLLEIPEAIVEAVTKYRPDLDEGAIKSNLLRSLGKVWVDRTVEEVEPSAAMGKDWRAFELTAGDYSTLQHVHVDECDDMGRLEDPFRAWTYLDRLRLGDPILIYKDKVALARFIWKKAQTAPAPEATPEKKD